MTPQPIPITNCRELPDVVFDRYTCCPSHEKAAMDFKARFGKEPTAIYSYVNPTTGHTTMFVTAEEI
jgi:hypothetical protein